MRYMSKGFSLIELLVTVSVVAIVAALAVPSFTSTIQNNKADAELNDLQRALNYARLEAINRGVTVRIAPTSGADWKTELQVFLASDTSATPTALRKVAPLSSGATLTATDVTGIEFNNLGALSTPTTAVVMNYTRGSIARTMNICLTGRIILGGSC
ncbi:GspH/FimT family pseudopilin [Pseudomonas capsici]|uniref:Type II secretion system protein H n=1 Tax=Pseudomonas capsici TaxID=2810614 RepID=A0ABT3C3Z3_9PSED|nr:GspH/FimT family protein [Pseudomonas capsici]MBX8609129.1 GspH/FimT family protein [Pseudomonas cichorii]MBN6712922.1 GspH/FimT family protein [Pseudomonas capsici]MBN6717914.1 GspH/FimT family protein [Pseudomonas capsici]MBN6722372.1 GspH/FimT family protein [Pseudomonas capsici]MBX8610704.1 GspH/FimT family protein [Pseudomonas cichorii]